MAQGYPCKYCEKFYFTADALILHLLEDHVIEKKENHE